MIAFFGDVHRRCQQFEEAIESLPPDVAAVMQVGDLQVWPSAGMPPHARQFHPSRSVHFIDGNWDYYPWFRGLTQG